MISEIFHLRGSQPGLSPDILGSIFGMPVSNVWLMMWLVFIFLVVALFFANRRLALVPGTAQSYAEVVVEGMSTLIEQVTGSKGAVRRLLPVSGPLFVFLVLANSIGIIPGLGAITYDGFSLFRTATSDYNVTLVLGVLVSVFVNGSTIAQIGLGTFIEKFIQLRLIILAIPKGFMATFQAAINAFVGLMDIIGEIAKVLSMTLRLFGNIYAGEVMTVVFYGLFSLVVPSAWHVLSTFSGVIQALVFTMLTTVFYSLSIDTSSD